MILEELAPDTIAAGEFIGPLRDLALYLRARISEGISKGTITPEQEPTTRWKVEHFEYGDTGITSFGATDERGSRESWYKAWVKLLLQVPSTVEYEQALKFLESKFQNGDKLRGQFSTFVSRLIREFLNNPQLDDGSIDALISAFVRNLRNEPVRYEAKIELVGVALKTDEISINPKLKIRRTRKEDLEIEVAETSLYPLAPYGILPSAILTFEIVARSAREVQIEAERVMTLLRLFRVGSVSMVSLRTDSDSITDLMASGVLKTGARQPLETYLLTDTDVSKLQKFWDSLATVLPTSWYDQGLTEPDHLTIAYTRFSDALIQNGLIERRIANAVMGLEALFLREGEAQELSHHLRIRVAKLLGLIGYDSLRFQEILKDAYRIRSTFVHGGQLGSRDRAKLDAKYKDTKSLLSSSLDCLRASLVLTIVLGKPKKQLLKLLDDSFVDAKADEQLVALVSEAPILAAQRLS